MNHVLHLLQTRLFPISPDFCLSLLDDLPTSRHNGMLDAESLVILGRTSASMNDVELPAGAGCPSCLGGF